MQFEVLEQRATRPLGGSEWRWRLRAANGQIIALGESYANLQDCLHAISLVRKTTILTPIINANTGASVFG
jgi:uncharacterized protein YegP (UPF0339 family)